MDLDRAIRIINYDTREKVTNLEQVEAYRTYFKELFDTDIQDECGNYKSVYQILLETSKKFKKEEMKDNN